jgi:hypothetical protein
VGVLLGLELACAVGGTGVLVGGTGVLVDGTRLLVGGTGVLVAVAVGVGGTRLLVGGTGVLVGGTGVLVTVAVGVGGTHLLVGGTGVLVGGTGVFVAVGAGVAVAVAMTVKMAVPEYEPSDTLTVCEPAVAAGTVNAQLLLAGRLPLASAVQVPDVLSAVSSHVALIVLPAL